MPMIRYKPEQIVTLQKIPGQVNSVKRFPSVHLPASFCLIGMGNTGLRFPPQFDLWG